MKRSGAIAILLLLVLALVLTGAVASADEKPDGIGRAEWRMKCHGEMSVIVQELPDGTNLVTCFLYY